MTTCWTQHAIDVALDLSTRIQMARCLQSEEDHSTTRIRTGSDHLFQALGLTCQRRQAEHVQMDRKSQALEATQNYEPGFVKKAAQLTPS